MNNRQRMIVFSTVALLAMAVFAVQASAQNVLTNGDLETGDITGWQVFGESPNSAVTIVADNGPAAPGTNCAFLDNHAEALSLTFKQSSPAGSAGEGTFLYSFDLKLGEAALGGVFFVEIFAEMAGGGVIGGSGVLGNYTPADWTTFSGEFNAPAGTDFVTIQLSAINGANAGSVSTMYVDNVVLDLNGIVASEPSSWDGVKSLYR